MVIYRDLRPSDFESLSNNFFSFIDEQKENPDLGLVLVKKKPTLSEELEWFSDFYKNVEQGKTIATVAEADSKVVGVCEVERMRPDSDVSHRGGLGLADRKGVPRAGNWNRIVKAHVGKVPREIRGDRAECFQRQQGEKTLRALWLPDFRTQPARDQAR